MSERKPIDILQQMYNEELSLYRSDEALPIRKILARVHDDARELAGSESDHPTIERFTMALLGIEPPTIQSHLDTVLKIEADREKPLLEEAKKVAERFVEEHVIGLDWDSIRNS